MTSASPRRSRAARTLAPVLAATITAVLALTGCTSVSSPIVERPVERALRIPPLDEGLGPGDAGGAAGDDAAARDQGGTSAGEGGPAGDAADAAAGSHPAGGEGAEAVQRRFRLRIDESATDFGGSAPTATMGVNGAYLGPTLRMRTGDAVRIDVRNDLTERTTLHWHGMAVPARMDGGPHQLVEPGTTWSPIWRVRQPAGTLWYHAHPHGTTAEHVYRGVAGMILVDDPTPIPGLPRRYGVDDIPVIVQDKTFDDAGQLVFDQAGPSSTGFLGDTIMVNGTVGAYLDVAASRVRLRLLNASTARIYRFGLADDRAFDVVGTDGGLLTAPVTLDRIQLSPGERADIVVAMDPGETIDLRSYSPDFGSRVGPNSRFGTGEYRVLQLRAAAQLTPSPAPSVALAGFARIPESAAQRSRTFTINAQIINRRPVDMGRIDEVVPRSATEVWVLRNRDPQPHNFHVHAVQFQVLDIDGRPPPGELAGWKDTVYLAPGSQVRIIATFPDWADPRWPYMYHCHLLWHEDSGLMGQFVVLAPGQMPAPLPDPYEDH
jgi:FtsP/CotA-like multicopper oxidase with cupredoxin domain